MQGQDPTQADPVQPGTGAFPRPRVFLSVRAGWLTNQLLISKQKPRRLGKGPLKSMDGKAFEIEQEKHQKGTPLKCLPVSEK